MTADDEPQWQLLPGDPLGFFELSEPFTEVDLRRRYNALLRRYKPERAPERFLQLRAAYEALRARLRAEGGAASSEFELREPEVPTMPEQRRTASVSSPTAAADGLAPARSRCWCGGANRWPGSSPDVHPSSPYVASRRERGPFLCAIAVTCCGVAPRQRATHISSVCRRGSMAMH
jgi:hypothetical protein